MPGRAGRAATDWARRTASLLSPEHISCTRGLVDWLIAHGVSLAQTTYQTGGLYLVGVDTDAIR